MPSLIMPCLAAAVSPSQWDKSLGQRGFLGAQRLCIILCTAFPTFGDPVTTRLGSSAQGSPPYQG